MTSQNILWISSVLLILIGIFPLIREILCWYWKINRVVDLLEKIEENTRSKDIVKEVVKEK